MSKTVDQIFKFLSSDGKAFTSQILQKYEDFIMYQTQLMYMKICMYIKKFLC